MTAAPFQRKMKYINVAQPLLDAHDKKMLELGLSPVIWNLAEFKKNPQPPCSNTGVINPQNLQNRPLSARCLNTKKVEFDGKTLRLPLGTNAQGLISHAYSVGSVGSSLLPPSPPFSRAATAPAHDDVGGVGGGGGGGAVKGGAGAAKDLAFIDFLSFSFKTEKYYAAFPDSKAISPDGDDFVVCFSERIAEILGYGVTVAFEHGKFNYQRSWAVGNQCGIFACGGNEDTAFLSLTGQGLMVAVDGFEHPLYEFMKKISASITRIDLAHDIFDGFGYSVDRCRSDYKEGLYHVRGVRPSAEARGNWDYIDNKGRSYYIGSRSGGKMLRVYEKGLQLGGAVADVFKDWVRIEVEFRKNSARPVLPLEMVINSGEYLAGAYPALNFLHDTQQRIITTKSAAKATFEKIKKYVEVTCSKSLSFIYNCFCNSDEKEFMNYLHECVFVDDVMDLPKRFLDVMPSLRPQLPAFELPKTFDNFLNFGTLPEEFKSKGYTFYESNIPEEFDDSDYDYYDFVPPPIW